MNKVKMTDWDSVRELVKTNKTNMPERLNILSISLDYFKEDEKDIEHLFMNSRTISPVQNNESDYLEQSVHEKMPVRTFQTRWYYYAKKEGEEKKLSLDKRKLEGIMPRFSEAYIELSLPKQKANLAQWGILKLSGKFYVPEQKISEGEEKEFFKSLEESKKDSKKELKIHTFKFIDLEEDKEVAIPMSSIVNGIWYGRDNGHCSAIASASDAKYKKLSLYATSGVENFSNAEWSRHVHHGMYEELYSALPKNDQGGLIPGKKLSQASTRLSQMRAPSKRLARIRKYAIIFGVFKGGSPTPFEYFDGSALLNVVPFTAALNEELESIGSPFYVEEDLVLGQGVQARPYSIKSYFTVVKPEVIISAINHHGNGVSNVVELVAEDMTQQERADFIAALNKDKDSPYWGKTVVVSMTKEDIDAEIDFLADMNAFKAPYWPEEHSYFNVLELSHGSHGDIKMSAQLCKTLFSANREKARELVLERAKELTHEKLMALESGSKAHLQDLRGDLGQLAVKIAPNFVLEDSATLYRSQVDNIAEGLSNIINDFNLPLTGEYGAVIPDCSLLFKQGKGLLNFGEVYIPGLVDKDSYEQNIERYVMLIKYPKMGNHEFMYARVLSKWEYVDRVYKAMKSNEMSRDDFNLFKEMIHTLKRGLCVLPAIPETMKLLAGLDYDGDKVGIITDEKVIEIIQGFKPIIAAIE